MTHEVSTFSGSPDYPISCTGDAVVGDCIAFDRATFSGSWRNPSFAGFERVEARIIRDSYGAEKQQHTFTLERADGTTTRIKGRNLYAQGVWRKPWADEAQREAARDEKHERGDARVPHGVIAKPRKPRRCRGGASTIDDPKHQRYPRKTAIFRWFFSFVRPLKAAARITLFRRFRILPNV